jgi:uncharacterized protein YaiL (DUF2058 family)
MINISKSDENMRFVFKKLFKLIEVSNKISNENARTVLMRNFGVLNGSYEIVGVIIRVAKDDPAKINLLDKFATLFFTPTS